jgi:putative phage-type endonuclease
MTDMIEQRSPEWFEQRRKRVTASSVGAILGHDPYRDRNDVMRAMARDALGAPSEFDGNIATRYGQANEQNARLDFELETGLSIDDAPFVAFDDWAGASPDGWVGDNAIIEIKCPFSLRKETQPVFKKLTDQQHYLDQVQFQLFCTGKDKAHFFQWSPYGNDWTVTFADHAWRDENLPRLKQFYAEFLDALSNPDEYLKPKRITLDSPEAHKMIREWDEVNEQLGWLEERKKDLLAQIVQAAGEKDAEFAGRKLTKVVKVGAVSWAKMAKDHCPNVDTTPYLGKPSEHWRLS